MPVLSWIGHYAIPIVLTSLQLVREYVRLKAAGQI